MITGCVAVYSNVPMALAAAIVESVFGSLIVPELARVVDTVSVLLAMFRIALASVMLRIEAVSMPVPPTVYAVAPESFNVE